MEQGLVEERRTENEEREERMRGNEEEEGSEDALARLPSQFCPGPAQEQQDSNLLTMSLAAFLQM